MMPPRLSRLTRRTVTTAICAALAITVASTLKSRLAACGALCECGAHRPEHINDDVLELYGDRWQTTAIEYAPDYAACEQRRVLTAQCARCGAVFDYGPAPGMNERTYLEFPDARDGADTGWRHAP